MRHVRFVKSFQLQVGAAPLPAHFLPADVTLKSKLLTDRAYQDAVFFLLWDLFETDVLGKTHVEVPECVVHESAEWAAPSDRDIIGAIMAEELDDVFTITKDPSDYVEAGLLAAAIKDKLTRKDTFMSAQIVNMHLHSLGVGPSATRRVGDRTGKVKTGIRHAEEKRMRED
jgi:hypothetical protein